MIKKISYIILLFLVMAVALEGCAGIYYREYKEKFLLAPPQVGSQWYEYHGSRDSGQPVVRMIQKTENIDNWTELVSIEETDLENTAMENVLENVRFSASMYFRTNCDKDPIFKSIRAPGRFFYASCARWRDGSPAESRLLRIMTGLNKVYAVYRAKRSAHLDEETLQQWVKYLSEASVCDAGNDVNAKALPKGFLCKGGEVEHPYESRKQIEGLPIVDTRPVNVGMFRVAGGGIIFKDGRPVLTIHIENKFYDPVWIEVKFEPPGAENPRCSKASMVEAGDIVRFACEQVRDILETDYAILVEVYENKDADMLLESQVQHMWFQRDPVKDKERPVRYNHGLR